MSLSRCVFAARCAQRLQPRLVVRCLSNVHSSSAPAKQVVKMSSFIAEPRGAEHSPEYRVFLKDAMGPVSPLHDVPLWAERAAGVAHMVVEVPRWTNAKMEISLQETLNPIKQDTKKGVLRYVANVFPHHGYPWNYGALPQTWEDPRHVDPATGARGDNDPIDVVEIGGRVAARGEVVAVKILGVLALIDEGETDWKLLAVDVNDPRAARLSGVSDLERECPGLLRATVEWFRMYKVPDGKPVNQFAFDGQAKDREFALNVIDETHGFWKELVSGRVSDTDINIASVTNAESPRALPRAAAAAALAAAPPAAPPAPAPHALEKWSFVSNL